MNKLLLLMLMMVFPMVASPQGYVNNFKWEENEGTYNGFPLVTVAVGDKHKLQYSYTTNTMGTDIFDVNSGNWVFYENNTVVNAPTVFSMNAQGVVTGIKEGLGALKPTGLILKASGTDRLYIKVVSSYEEQEPNNDFNSANELKGAPTTFGLYNLSDIDYFKVKANAGDKITFKIKGDNSNNKFFGFKWSKFSSTYQSLGSGSLAIDESTGERDIEISSAFTSNYGTGYYYLEIYYDQSRSQYFTYDKLTVQAFLNDKPVSYEETEPDPEPVYDVKFSYDDSNMTATVIAGDNKYTGNIVIPESVMHNGNTYKVTSIGESAFYICTGLTSVTIPNSVTSIGDAAFYNCIGLTSVTIPNSVTSIGDEAFYACFDLTSVTIPNSVTSIGESAFSLCTGLTSVTIPNSVTSIGDEAFYDCSGLTAMTVEDGNTIYDSRNNCNAIIKTGTNELISGCNSTVIPNSVTSIGKYAFIGCSGLTSVTIPNSVTSIGEGAFYECSGLTSVTIPDCVTSIKHETFKGCTGLTSVTIGNGVTSIRIKAFASCPKLTDVYCHAVNVPDTSNDAFEGSNTNNAALHVPTKSVNAYRTIAPWSGFKEIVAITDGVQLYNLSYFVDGVLYKTYDLEAGTPITPEPAPTKEGYTFSGWSEIPATMPAHDVTVTGSFTSINNDVLKYSYMNSSQTAIVVGIKEGFSGDLVIPEFVEKDGKTYKVVTIANGAFKDCVGLSTVVIPNSVTSIGSSAFSGCSGLTSVTIPNSVNSIGGGAFSGCTSLSSINIPTSLTTIEYDLFNGCSNLTSITIPNGVTSIGDDAFSGCSSLNTIEIPENVSVIGTSAFEGCVNLSTIVIGSGVKTIYTGAFANCTNLKEVYCYAEAVPAIVRMHYDNHNHVFDNSPISDAKLYVPQTSIANYKTKWPWSLFKQVLSLGGEFSYPEFIYEIGVDGGWMNSHPLRRKGDTGIYIGYYYLMGEFKFREHESDWDGNSWGLNKSTGKVSNSSDADNFSAEAGFYQVIVDLEDMTLTLNLISSIGVIGSYSGWSEDTDMAYDFDNNVWKVEHILFDQDENYFKFRANHSWDINWGGQPDNIILGGDNLSKGKGAYTIELRLSYEGNNRAIVNKEYFKLTYKVDDEVYKTLSYDYGAVITPEPAPTKEGYTFSGWSEIPETMPAKDVTVTGTFTINKYKLIYMVDGTEYKSYEIEYGAKITPEAEPTKEGYTFSGWSTIPATMPAKDVTVTGTFTVNKYKLIYMVDGVEYKSYEIEYGAKITPEAEPTKEGYTFSGWSSIPETMPAKDVTITGTFTKGAYKLTYMVDGEVYKTVTYDYGATITPEAEPTKEGYTFSGWSSIPETMPAKDVTVTGTFTVNKYTLTFMVGENVYETRTLEYGSTIIVPEMPELTGYTFSWGEVPATMPARDLTIVGEYQPNLYNVTYLIDGQFFAIHQVAYGSTITPPEVPERAGSTFTWGEYPETMPAHDIIIEGTYTLGINLVQGNQGDQYTEIYTVDGKKANRMQRGVNIIRRGSKVVKVAR